MEINPTKRPGNLPVWGIMRPVYRSDLSSVPRVERSPQYYDSEESALEALNGMYSGTAFYRQTLSADNVLITTK